MKTINLVVDTSGSIVYQKLNEKIETLFNNSDNINIIYCDSEIHLEETINHIEDLPQLIGGGGSILQPALDLVKEKYSKFDTYIYTDGFTDKLDMSSYDKNLFYIKSDGVTEDLNININYKTI